jgi:hypothetical protein
MTYPESLRAYADWCERNPDLQQEGMIYTYGETSEQAKGIMRADPNAKIDLLPGMNIVYLTQRFGWLTIQHVLNKSDICHLSIADNKVVAALNPEFAELVRK